MGIFSRFFLLFTLFVTGACVMVVEILGTKVISPFFGVSLYVWSSLITVTLLSLALGYWMGGLLADAKPQSVWLYGIILVSGLTLAFVPVFSPEVIRLTQDLELRLGTLTASFLLFSWPLLGLGMVSPYAIRLRANKLELVGMTSGLLYAISTFGSFVGTIVAGFVLIPSMPVDRIFWLLAGTLILVAAGGLASSGHPRGMIIGLVIFLGVISAWFLYRPPAAGAGEARILHRSESFYGQIKVVDFKDVRSLLVNSSPQNFVYKDGGKSLFDHSPYVVYLAALLAYRPELERVLMIGLGGGTLAMLLAQYGVTVDVIEIDPRMVEVAQQYFGYEPRKGQVFLGDGRYVMKRLDARYDAFVLDAFSAYDQPSHLFTREMFLEVQRVLKKDGVIGINSAGFIEGQAARVPKSIFRTLEEVFPHVEAFHIEAKRRVGSVIFFASGAPLEFVSQPSRLGPADHAQLIQTLEASRAKDFLNGGIVLTDRYNPIPYWGVPIYKAWREEVIKFFGKEVLQKL